MLVKGPPQQFRFPSQCLVQFRSQRSLVLKKPRAVRLVVQSVLDYKPISKPNEQTLKLWQEACAVCFDVDCTVTNSDALDMLAGFMNAGDEVAKLTDKAMDGSMNLETALAERLRIINCTPDDLKAFLQQNPPQKRVVPNIQTLIGQLQARGIDVYLVSGGFREMIIPIADYLGVPRSNVFANRMNWQCDDETGLPTKLVGFDEREPTAHNKGKPRAIASLRELHPYSIVVMVGDGITDLEAVQESDGADLFIGYGGVVEREAVAKEADWFVYDHMELIYYLRRYTVTMVGSGAWACAALRMVAQSCKEDDPADEFGDLVKMWVYEEEIEGKGPLTQIINTEHENVKYLPGIKLPTNIQAVPDLVEAVEDADMLIFCAPHQFLYGICKQIKGKVKKDAVAISLTKGMRVRKDGPQLISQMIQNTLQIDCSVLMGANIATDIANEQLSESTIGFNKLENGERWHKLFHRDYFLVDLVPDVVGVEICGTLKNIIAIAAGLVDGLGYGANSKAAIMRNGFNEMRKLAKMVYPSVRDETFFESCGMADMIATCFGGRNTKVAAEWARLQKAGMPKTFDQLEIEILKGQKLQGILTSNEVQETLKFKGWEQEFPLFTTVNRVINGQLPVDTLMTFQASAKIPIPEEPVDVHPSEKIALPA
eukprot:TRINITY_DN9010_c0_g1_i4.p1 TRINITY_DN9010_c0_g1~~TRINITY_DN9010_c0_g1_i4.p1  ORF type:complete len:655 (-),score=102.82 TRINITY_DN9010_c0_g1_i4:319-2283(-)